MDNITHFVASFNDLPEIDLHNSTGVTEAIEQLHQELFLFYKQGINLCRVIYGIGTGTLEKAVREELTKNPMVVSFKKEERGGSCLVEL